MKPDLSPKCGFFASFFFFLDFFREHFLRRSKISLFLGSILVLGFVFVTEFSFPMRDARAFSGLARSTEDQSFFCGLEREMKMFGFENEHVSSSDDCSDESLIFSLAVRTQVEKQEDVSVTDAFSEEIALLTSGFPIERMAPAIARYDREIAALLVGIAKKESNWGKRVPVTPEGEDCFNYWGYKGAGTRGIAMGHGCFGSPEEAVEKVGDRLVELVSIRQSSDPERMTIWKCGSSCATHSPESVRKWVSDVTHYYRVIASQ